MWLVLTEKYLLELMTCSKPPTYLSNCSHQIQNSSMWSADKCSVPVSTLSCYIGTFSQRYLKVCYTLAKVCYTPSIHQCDVKIFSEEILKWNLYLPENKALFPKEFNRSAGRQKKFKKGILCYFFWVFLEFKSPLYSE